MHFAVDMFDMKHTNDHSFVGGTAFTILFEKKKLQNSILSIKCKWGTSYMCAWVEIGRKINGNIYFFSQTRSQLIKAGVKLLIQSKRKNSGSSSCDADYRPPPSKIRATSIPSPVSLTSAIPCEVPASLTSPKEEQIASPLDLDSFQIKTDDTSSCDEDSETKFSANKHEV